MNAKRPPGLFVTGTNTGVGKTYVAARIARWLVNAGFRVGVYKPVISGCHSAIAVDAEPGGDMDPDDDVLLWRAAGRPGELSRVSPQRFLTPVAPHLAAKAEGRLLNPELLRSGIEYWQQRSDIVLVEGAGGLMTPITEQLYVSDLMIDFGYPTVIVAANTLGVINQTLLTLSVALSMRHRGVRVAGIVLNQSQAVDVAADPSITSNLRELQVRCDPLPLVELGWRGSQFKPDVDWHRLAQPGSGLARS